MSLKVQRYPDIGLVLVNISETDKKRLSRYMEFTFNEKEYQGIAEIYGYIFENLNKPENYIVQYQNNEYIIQKLGK